MLLGGFLAISLLATPAAAAGPRAGTISWVEATTAAVAAGGVGGLFVPLLAIGDLCGRSLAPMLGVSGGLGAAAGAAGAIAGGYRLPLTAIAMVLTVGGPAPSRLTCVAAVLVATGTGVLTAYLLDRYVLHRKAGTPTAH